MSNIFIFHGTEGYPEENWFPWLKEKLEAKGHRVIVPQFPSPPIVPAKIDEWFAVLKNYEQYLDEEAIIVGHSLGGVLALRVLEKLAKQLGVELSFIPGAGHFNRAAGYLEFPQLLEKLEPLLR